MSKIYIVCCIVVKESKQGKGSKENHHAHNTSHGTVHTKIATKQVPQCCCVFPFLQISLRVTMHKSSDKPRRL